MVFDLILNFPLPFLFHCFRLMLDIPPWFSRSGSGLLFFCFCLLFLFVFFSPSTCILLGYEKKKTMDVSRTRIDLFHFSTF